MRRTSGSTLAFTAALAFVIVLVGVFVFFFMLSFGGSKENENMTQAGALNVGKKALNSINVSLQPGVEVTNFGALSEKSNSLDPGHINLKVYNRIIAKTMLVGLNARAEGTAQATANAQALYNAVQGTGTTSLSKRLITQLNDPLNSMQSFLEVMPQAGMKMLGSNAAPFFDQSRYKVANVDTPDNNNSNVFIDPTIIPAGASLPSSAYQVSSGKPKYLKGYTDIDTGPFKIQPIPLSPGVRTHLISSKDFQSGLAKAQAASKPGNVPIPPNAFQVSCKPTNTSKQTQAIFTDAYATIGTMGATTFQAAIPDGYLKVINQGGYKTITQLLQETGAQGDFNTQVVVRMRQINPTVTPAVCQELLDKTYMNTNDVFYIYWDSLNSKFVCNATKPGSFTGQAADGGLSHYCPNAYYHAVWYPSTGYNNLLGTLMFFSGVIDGVTVEGYR